MQNDAPDLFKGSACGRVARGPLFLSRPYPPDRYGGQEVLRPSPGQATSTKSLDAQVTSAGRSPLLPSHVSNTVQSTANVVAPINMPVKPHAASPPITPMKSTSIGNWPLRAISI